MSLNEKINTNKTSNIKRISIFGNEQLFSRAIPKKISKKVKEKINPKMSFNPKFIPNFKNILNLENDDFSDASQDIEYNENREKQLEILNKKYTKLYKSKEIKYENIINEINLEKKLFYKGSIMSFNLLILKIKCLLKILKEKFQNPLKTKDERKNYEFDAHIQKIKNEFIKIYSKLNEDSKYEYEIITQVYCKFLFIMAIISNKQEEYIRSFGFISLGVNMLKVYFVRQKMVTDIETYNIYAKLLILLINKLIADNNINQSLIYINPLSKICEIGLNFIFKKKLHKNYEYKFNKYNGYNFLFLGYCYELKNNNSNYNKICLKVYKEAFYFMNKCNKQLLFTGANPILTIEKKSLYLSKLLYEKMKEKLIYLALEKQREFEQQEKIKKRLIEEAKSKEKKYKLKLISCGLSLESNNLVNMQQKIYKEILTPANQKLIEKLDDELISYVYKDMQTNNNNDKKDIIKIKNKNLNVKNYKTNKKRTKLEKKLPSMEIMKNLCHYKIYNSLMSKDFKEFLLNNKNLEFNSPHKQKISLDKIQKFLNRKMEIDSHSENGNKEKEVYEKLKIETNLNSNNNILSPKLKLKNNQQKKYKFEEIAKNSTTEPNSSNYMKFMNSQSAKTNKPLTSNDKHSFIVSRNKDKNISNVNNKIISTYSTFTESLGNSKKCNLKSKSMLTYRAKLDNRKIDKFIFNKKYFNEYLHFENLTNRELDFQKKFLESKKNNSKMFFKGYDTELSNNGIISKDDVYNSFLIMNDEITSRDRNYEKEIKIQIEKKIKPKIIGNVFKSVDNKIEGGKEVKTAMRKILDKYILKQKKSKVNKNLVSNDEINKKNEFSILKLNNNIKEINYLLISKSNEAKSNNGKLNNYLKYSDI